MAKEVLDMRENREIEILFVDDNPDEFVLMEWLCSRASSYKTNLICVSSIEEACDVIEKRKIDMILLDNKLHKNDDFRTSVPVLRSKSFIGPIGIVSSSIEPEYFQEFEQYGADFRIGKSELDRNALGFIIDEFAGKKYQLPDD
ncbi:MULTISPECIES: response regulator [unclassified Lentilitoribacter]|jgi:CheY-like chemotaxis protein|uniref:response regulator n=1 Tax=unclassified Lentilitoribacter TaxID=2647570 RepID=UPI0013A6B4C8|nr:response regulator [Lentilitoribacter sp. Alg239-R112]